MTFVGNCIIYAVCVVWMVKDVVKEWLKKLTC
jgi:hypothetical protein